jgi:hypothetical protein
MHQHQGRVAKASGLDVALTAISLASLPLGLGSQFAACFSSLFFLSEAGAKSDRAVQGMEDCNVAVR